MNKILTKPELQDISNEIETINTTLESLDASIPKDEHEMKLCYRRLDELQTIISNSLKNLRRQNVGLVVIK